MTWGKGQATIERLLSATPAELERVEPNNGHAHRLLEESERHVASARAILDNDPTGAAQLAYDAARKSCVALLTIQGLRPTTAGGHIAVADAVRDQFNGPTGASIFGDLHHLRRLRAETQYPDPASPPTTAEDCEYILEVADGLVVGSRQIVESGRVGPF